METIYSLWVIHQLLVWDQSSLCLPLIMSTIYFEEFIPSPAHSWTIIKACPHRLRCVASRQILSLRTLINGAVHTGCVASRHDRCGKKVDASFRMCKFLSKSLCVQKQSWRAEGCVNFDFFHVFLSSNVHSENICNSKGGKKAKMLRNPIKVPLEQCHHITYCVLGLLYTWPISYGIAAKYMEPYIGYIRREARVIWRDGWKCILQESGCKMIQCMSPNVWAPIPPKLPKGFFNS